MCKHGVYKKEESKPVVIYQEGCVEGCHGCQNQCPAEAITYFGDNGADV
jgi:NAD-dependent dihydropyrimidine dehydrogenase PreA subunit